jgi:hypothetical protein
LVEFQSFVVGQILVVLGSFGQILLLRQWLTVPEDHLKALKPHNFWTVSPNFTCSVLLESYQRLLSTFQISSTSKDYCSYSSLLKTTKSRFGCRWCLWVNIHLIMKFIVDKITLIMTLLIFFIYYYGYNKSYDSA